MDDLTPPSHVPTEAEAFVEEVLDAVREAWFARALHYCRGDRLTRRDMKEAGVRLFSVSNVTIWPSEVAEHFI